MASVDALLDKVKEVAPILRAMLRRQNNPGGSRGRSWMRCGRPDSIAWRGPPHSMVWN
jgi:hypothetical protein